jgi:hypothetical protein
VIGEVAWVPAAASVPFHPPEAVQEVALVELQVSVAAAPFATTFDCALRLAVGTGGGADPPPQALIASDNPSHQRFILI